MPTVGSASFLKPRLRGLADFLERLDPRSEGLWLAFDGDLVIGSVAIVRDDQRATRLRWFIVDPAKMIYGLLPLKPRYF